MSGVTRRELLRGGAAAGAVGLAALGRESLIARALAAAPRCHSALEDIEHVIFFIQENRSFDSYFGSYRGVDGFADPHALKLDDGSGLSIFAQPGYPGGYDGDHLYPFRFNSYANGECTNDIDHSWGPQHTYWDGGRLDGFVRGHIKVDGPQTGPLCMGYYTRADLHFYYALADAFTLCDQYHCSVIGPTDPNRLYTVSAWLGADGERGGPILSTSTTRVQRFGKLSWTTMPEVLESHGISWKVYGSPDGNFGDNVLPYFKQYLTNPVLAEKALTPSYPGTFQADVAAGQLPQVSWILAPLVNSEHPPAPPEYGEVVAANVLNTLVSNPALWAKTALFITYDENGGYFDHVPPPYPPPKTAGEYLTVSPLPADAEGFAGPIGLGFRVPMLVVSPFSRGGLVCSDTFDHTSMLRFLETRFGAEVPNLSAWRRSVTGDLTGALNFIAPAETAVPSLPQPSAADPRVTSSSCAVGAPLDLATEGSTTLFELEQTVVPPYPVTVNSRRPPQEPGTAPAPSGLAPCTSARRGRLTAHGIDASSTMLFSGTIARFDYSQRSTPRSRFAATIDWGDGARSAGRIAGSGGAFTVQGHHRFRHPGTHRVLVRITGPAGAQATARSQLTVIELTGVPRRCARSFTATLRGSGLAGASFRLDGRTLHTDTERSGSVYRAHVTLPPGEHELTVLVTFRRSRDLSPRTLRRTVDGSGSCTPAFTG
jgi:phospholipase C